MKTKSAVLLFGLGVVLTGIYSCVNHDLAGPFEVACVDETPYTYDKDIIKLVNLRCADSDCHHAGSTYPPDWTDYETLKDHSDEVQRRITLPLNHPDKMPRRGNLTTEERQTLYCWIEQGAPKN